MQSNSDAREQNAHWSCIDRAVSEAWRAHDNAAGLVARVNPAIPILFFGDLSAYQVAPLRTLTVGLNPSRREFPSGRAFSRFPLSDEESYRDQASYLGAMSRYFRTEPYHAWFNAWEPLLNGAGVSHYGGASSTALHTDLCSPVATDPTWSRLGKVDRHSQQTLEADGVPLWHILLNCLKPEVVALSIAEQYLKRIEFEPIDKAWSSLHTFERTGTSAPRSRPYEVRKRWYDVGGTPSLFVFGLPAQTPFGLITAAQKYEVGAMVLEAYQNGR